jgi:hypothetical protein
MGAKWIEKNDAYYAINENGRSDGSMCFEHECSQKLPLYQGQVTFTSGLGMNLSTPEPGAVCQLAKSLCSGLFTALEVPGGASSDVNTL